MASAWRWGGQLAAYALFGVALAWLSVSPSWRHHDPQLAQIKLSFNHAAQRVGECRRLTPEEIAALPPNMRRPVDCPRERLPVVVELDLDGSPLLRATVPPSGLAGDGPASVYHRFAVPAGEHQLAARLRDSAREDGFDYEAQAEVNLAPRQNLVVDFAAPRGGFKFR